MLSVGPVVAAPAVVELLRGISLARLVELVDAQLDARACAAEVAEDECWGLPRVEQLSLAKCSLGVSGCQLLANLPTDLVDTFDDFKVPPPLALGQLRSLDLRGCTIGDAGFEVLAGAATLGALRTLDLTQNRLGEASLDHLRKSELLTGLTELSLAGNNELGPLLGQLAG